MFGRILTTLLAAGAVAATAIVAPILQIEIASGPEAKTQNVAARSLELVCPGSAVRTGGAAGTKGLGYEYNATLRATSDGGNGAAGGAGIIILERHR